MTNTGGRQVRVVIMGCGRTGSMLAELLDRGGHEVTIIDWDRGSFARLNDGFGGRTVLGNALDVDVLREAGLEGADAFVAATSGDNRNIVASEIAQTEFGVGRIVARIKDPNRAEYFHRRDILVDCRTTVSARTLLAFAEEALSEQTA